MSPSPLRVLICGAYSTGKTTIVQKVATHLCAQGLRVTICPDVARACPFPLNRQQSVSTTMWLAAMQIRAEIEAGAGNADVVCCDRGLPDILSHHVVDGIDDANGLTRAFVTYARAWAASYHAVFRSCIDPHVSIAADGLRLTDEAYRRALDDAMTGVLKVCRVDAEDLPHEPEARTALIEHRVLAALKLRDFDAD